LNANFLACRSLFWQYAEGEAAMILYVASMGWAMVWLAISFLLTAAALTYCVSYLNSGD
jgi:hypothetical protein